MVRDFDDNEFPLAYLISFRCYGTWVHGDTRRSVDRKQNAYGTPKTLCQSKASAIGHETTQAPAR